MAHRTNRGDVIATLNRLVADGVIASFRTDLFDRDEAGSAPSVAVMVHDAHDPEPTLQRVRDALEPLGINLTVRLSRWQ